MRRWCSASGVGHGGRNVIDGEVAGTLSQKAQASSRPLEHRVEPPAGSGPDVVAPDPTGNRGARRRGARPPRARESLGGPTARRRGRCRPRPRAPRCARATSWSTRAPLDQGTLSTRRDRYDRPQLSASLDGAVSLDESRGRMRRSQPTLLRHPRPLSDRGPPPLAALQLAGHAPDTRGHVASGLTLTRWRHGRTPESLRRRDARRRYRDSGL